MTVHCRMMKTNVGEVGSGEEGVSGKSFSSSRKSCLPILGPFSRQGNNLECLA